MKKVFAFLLCVGFGLGVSHAQEFRSKLAGAWSTVSNWETLSGSLWIPATAAPSTNAVVTISSGHTMDLGQSLTLSNLTIASGGSLQYSGSSLTLTVNSGLSNNGTLSAGTNNVVLNGAVSGTGTISATGGTVTYNQASPGQAVLAGNYYDLTFSDFSKVLPSSGTVGISNIFTPGAATGHTVTGSTISYNGPNSQTVVPFRYHNLKLSGTRSNGGSLSLGGAGAAETFYVAGDLIVDAVFSSSLGTLGINDAGSATLIFNGSGNQMYNVAYTAGGDLKFLFIGTVHIANNTGIVTANSPIKVNNNYIVDGKLYFSGENYIFGTGAITVNNGATLGITSKFGLSKNGHVQTNNSAVKTFSSGAHYLLLYPQAGATGETGSFFPATVTGSLTVNTPATTTVNLTQAVTTSNLILTSGSLGLGGKTLSLNGTISRTSGSVNASNGTVVFNGTAAQSFPSGTFATSIQNLTINTSNGAEVTMNNNLTVSNAFTLTSGTLVTAGQSLTLSGPVSRTGGSVNATSGTLVFNGATAQSVPAGSFTGTIQNLTISNASGVTLNSDRTVTGTLSLTNGPLQFSGSALTMGDGSTINRSAGSLTTAPAWGASVNVTYTNSSNITTGVEIPASHVASTLKTLTLSAASGASVALGTNATAADNLVLNSGTLSLSGKVLTLGGTINRTGGVLDASSGTITFSSSTAQTIPAGLFNGNLLQHLTLNGSDALSLSENLSVTGTLTLSNGHLNLGNNHLTMGSASAVSGGSPSSHVVINGAGTLIRNGLAGSQVFPIGISAGSYTPVTISNPSGVNWTVGLLGTITPAPDTWQGENGLKRTWNISPSATPGATDLIFRYDESDAGIRGSNWPLGFSDGASIVFKHYNSTQSTWETVGSTMAQAVGGTTYTVTLMGQTDFSPFALSNTGSVLPVSYLSFTGKREGGVNVLQWQTAQESSNKGFEVERSPDGVHFSSIGFVASKAPGGNSTSPLSYGFEDKTTTASPSLYYRLRQTDRDGKTKISPVVTIRTQGPAAMAFLRLYPNPVHSTLTLQLESADKGTLMLRIMDAGGRTVTQRMLRVAAGPTTLGMPLQTLQAGTYYLVVDGPNGHKQTINFLKN